MSALASSGRAPYAKWRMPRWRRSMSILSELKRRAGPRVQLLAAGSEQSNSGGVPAKLLLAMAEGRKVSDAFAIAHLLVDVGITPRGARKAIDDLVEGK